MSVEAGKDRGSRRPDEGRLLSVKESWRRMIMEAVELTPTVRLVGLRAVDYADAGGWFWVSQGHLAALLGLSERTVRRSVAQLIRHGWLDRQHRGGGRKASRYRAGCPPIACLLPALWRRDTGHRWPVLEAWEAAAHGTLKRPSGAEHRPSGAGHRPPLVQHRPPMTSEGALQTGQWAGPIAHVPSSENLLLQLHLRRRLALGGRAALAQETLAAQIERTLAGGVTLENIPPRGLSSSMRQADPRIEEGALVLDFSESAPWRWGEADLFRGSLERALEVLELPGLTGEVVLEVNGRIEPRVDRSPPDRPAVASFAPASDGRAEARRRNGVSLGDRA